MTLYQHASAPVACILACIAMTSCAQKVDDNRRSLTFVTCTPCGKEVRPINDIPPGAECDLIKWKLTLFHDATSANPTSFKLDSEWGFYINNWTYEKRGQIHTEGKCEFAYTRESGLTADVYRLTTDKSKRSISLVKLNDNLVHLMDNDQNLLAGNGGWSYTLSNAKPVSHVPSSFVDDAVPSNSIAGSDSVLIFQGRTPCRELADRLGLSRDGSCTKLKWLLKLHVDPITRLPRGYELERTGHRQSIITGTWAIAKGTPESPGALIYQLDPDKPQQTLLLMKGDDHVLFFLDEHRELLVGNGDFGYTLNSK